MTRPIHAATLTGLVDLADPDPAAISVAAIARGLCRPRWANATELPLTIAQHSVLVMEIFIRRNPALRHAAIYPLLHDAHEYLLGDLITPTVQLLANFVPALPSALGTVKARIDGVIRTALGVPAPEPSVESLIWEADRLAAHVEWVSLIPAVNGRSPFACYGSPVSRVKPLAWPQAEEVFRHALERELAARPWEVVTPRDEPARHYDRDGYCDSPYRGH